MTPTHDIPTLVLFGGGGLGSLGLERARFGIPGQALGRLKVVASIDAWDKACAVHDYLCPGSRAIQWDLFTRADYEAFHGHPPPEGWRETTPEDFRALFSEAGYPEGPSFVFFSPPCKGFSANLSGAKARTAKYQALNRLVARGIWLVMNAWPASPPALFIMENVPRIRNRGAELLATVQLQLRSYGYLLDDRDHDAGELGGLAQTRRRFLLAGRLPEKCPAPVQLAPKKPLRGVGEVLGQLPVPLPGADLPPMHEVPSRMHWLTALRLALIEPGRDWRDLARTEAYEVRWSPGRALYMVGAYRGEEWVTPPGWEEGIPLGRWAADEGALDRAWMAGNRRETAYTLREWDKPAGTVASSGGISTATGGTFVADPRVTSSWRRGNLGLTPWDAHTGVVTAGPSNRDGGKHVADPRLTQKKFNNAFRVVDWAERGVAVTGGVGPTSGGQAVADPRLGCECRSGAYGVLGWDETAPTVGAKTDVHNGTVTLADPRLGGRNAPEVSDSSARQTLRVPDGGVQSPTRGGGGNLSSLSVALGGGQESPTLPTLPGPRDPGAWVILSPWGTWNRPCTTLEVARLQSLPAQVPGEDGRLAPLDFYALGLSDADAREVIGNGVPTAAAQAIGEEFGLALLEGRGAVYPRLLLGGRWVLPVEDQPTMELDS